MTGFSASKRIAVLAVLIFSSRLSVANAEEITAQEVLKSISSSPVTLTWSDYTSASGISGGGASELPAESEPGDPSDGEDEDEEEAPQCGRYSFGELFDAAEEDNLNIEKFVKQTRKLFQGRSDLWTQLKVEENSSHELARDLVGDLLGTDSHARVDEGAPGDNPDADEPDEDEDEADSPSICYSIEDLFKALSPVQCSGTVKKMFANAYEPLKTALDNRSPFIKNGLEEKSVATELRKVLAKFKKRCKIR